MCGGDTVEALRLELERLKGELESVRAALGSDTPWPAPDVLAKLADAADHLLKEHDCDAHGHEEVGVARDAARRIAAALSTPPPASPGEGSPGAAVPKKGESDGR